MALLLNLSYALLAAVSIGAHFVLIPVHVNLTLTSMLIIYIGSHRALDSKEVSAHTPVQVSNVFVCLP